MGLVLIDTDSIKQKINRSERMFFVNEANLGGYIF